jgi:hypothetical protein
MNFAANLCSRDISCLPQKRRRKIFLNAALKLNAKNTNPMRHNP